MISSTATLLLACLLTHQTLSAANFGAKADGKSDSGPALQRALDSTKPGDVLVIPPGKYLVGSSLLLARDNVTVLGNNAVLVATDPARQTMQIAGNQDTLFGIDFEGTGTTRLGSNASTKIEVTGQHDLIEYNIINGGASAGIFVYGAQDFAILNNQVTATLADGIHMTNGAKDGLVQGNKVADNGDDMIAVVSYAAQPAIDSDILIEDNSVSGNYWGRGISVVGGQNVTIRNNAISNVNQSAAIYLAEEEGRYHTHNVQNILIDHNTIKNTEMQNSFIPPAKHAAIYLFTWKGYVHDVLLHGNTVDGAGYGGFQAKGHVCSVVALDNQFTHITGENLISDLGRCALNVFLHCTPGQIGNVQPCKDDTTKISGSGFSGQDHAAGSPLLWNCHPGSPPP